MYFSLIPDLNYPTISPDSNSSFDYTLVKNLFLRGELRTEVLDSILAIQDYFIRGDDRPDNVADELYGRSDYDWIVLLSNNITDVHNQWPLSEYAFNTYVNSKYSQSELEDVHHYETLEVRDSDYRLVQEAGLEVDQNYSISYLDSGVVKTTSGMVKAITNLEYEQNLNDQKRSIRVLKPAYINLLISDLKDVMKYYESSQYLNSTTKQTENTRITDQ